MDQLIDRPRPDSSPTSFTFEVTMDWNHMSSYFSTNGFLVHVGDVYTMFGRPIAAAGGMHTVIDVSYPTRRIDRSGCIKRELIDFSKGPYDDKGYNCIGYRYMKEVMPPLIG